MSFRKVIFWAHLVAGVVCGLVIGIMSFTGAALAFEKEIIAWAERDARQVVPPAPGAARLSVDEIMKRLAAAQPAVKPASLIFSTDPAAPIAIGAGRSATAYINPYTAEVHEGQAVRTRAFMQTMNSWHRWLGQDGEHRNLARAVTGACNFAFLALGVTGLYLWWPRAWSARAVRAIALFNFRLRGKARDFNWHNVIGLWSAPVLIVLTATALPMSYTWASDLIYRLTGTEAPAQGGGGGGGPGVAISPVELPKPPEGAQPLGYDALIAAAQKEAPHWDQLTLRLSGAAGGRGGAGGGPGFAGAGGRGGGSGGGRGGRGAGAPGGRGGGQGGEGRGRGRGMGEAGAGGAISASTANGSQGNSAQPQPVTIAIRESGSWPRTATTTLTLDPYTGAVLRRDGFADQNLGRQIRSWTRFLHTGEALGPLGQLVAGLASFGGCVLMYTGFALAWRRFFGRRTPVPMSAQASSRG
jgi:uncharacterized iron-regulated membrane protein